MAKDVITRFKLETSGFDSQLKKAAKNLADLGKTASAAGKDFDKFTKSDVEAARALGAIPTSANNAKGKVKELVGAFNDAAKAYNALSDAQKQADWAKAMAGSLEQLKTRIADAKNEMQGLSETVQSVGDKGFGNKFDGMMAVFGGNMMTKAGDAVMQLGAHIVDITKRSIDMAAKAEGIKLAFDRLNRPDLLDGLRQATHGTVNDLELMTQAVKFKDFKLNIDQMGTLLAFAQQKAKDTGQSVDYMVDSIVTGLGRQSLLILDNLGLSAAEVKEKMKETGDMTTAVAEIIKQQMGEAGGYVETAADRIAKGTANVENAMLALGEQIAITFDGKSIDEMKNQLEVDLIKGITAVVKAVGTVRDAFLNLPPAIRESITALHDMLSSLNPIYSTVSNIWGLISGSSGAAADLRKIIENTQNQGFKGGSTTGAISLMFQKLNPTPPTTPKATGGTTTGKRSGGKSGGGRTSTAKTSGKPTTAQTIEKAEQDYYNAWMEAAQDMTAGIIKGDEYGKQVNAAQYKLAEAYRKAYETTGNEKYLKSFEDTATEANTFRDALKADAEQTKEQAEQKKKLKEAEEAYQKALNSGDYSEIAKTGEALSKLKDTAIVTGDSKGLVVQDSQNRGARAAYAASSNSMASLGGYISDLQADLKNADLGSEVYKSLTERLKDATMMQGVLTTLMDEGLKGADLQEAANELKTKLLAGDIDEAAWEDFIARVNEKLEEQGFDPIKIDIETGKVSKDIKGTWQDAAKAVESVGSAMSQIEDPAAKVMGTVAQAIASVALGAGKAIANYKTFTGWDWIAFAATATATMISTIASIHSATGYAQGGIVDGTQGGFVGGTAYSGDNVGNVRLDSGELVLSRAQQSSLAAELEGNPMQNLRLSTAISGRFLKIAIDNDSRSRNKGKLMTTNQ